MPPQKRFTEAAPSWHAHSVSSRRSGSLPKMVRLRGQAVTGCPGGKQHAAAGQVQTLGTKGGFLKRPE